MELGCVRVIREHMHTERGHVALLLLARPV